ncbi:MAG: ABC transporter ATP-binding protein [bacterium]|nr:ABC transporter ATP-binding protein [bacterium]MBK9775372.1 ABC transporter ATP-binding protein [bacterium]
MIEVKDLVKKYGTQRAVDGVSFSVARGELFGLLGPNGAGKTTTIGVLSTLLRADGGQVRIGGHDVATSPAQVRRLIGVVPQEIALYTDLTARDNLMFWGRLHGLGGAALSRRVEELLVMADLADQAKRRVDAYSGGMMRRLNLVAGLIHEPEVLFLDEPTVGIDAQARSRILELIAGLGRQGLTVIYTTHYLEEAEQLCDRIGVIDRGKLVALGDKESLIGQVGDVDLIRLSLPAAAHAAFVEACGAWADCSGVGERRGKVEVRAVDGGRLLPRIQDWLRANDLPLEQLEIERPNLETLYLNLTGRGLREDAS